MFFKAEQQHAKLTPGVNPTTSSYQREKSQSSKHKDVYEEPVAANIWLKAQLCRTASSRGCLQQQTLWTAS